MSEWYMYQVKLPNGDRIRRRTHNHYSCAWVIMHGRTLFWFGFCVDSEIATRIGERERVLLDSHSEEYKLYVLRADLIDDIGL
jgi:hypothetical protein